MGWVGIGGAVLFYMTFKTERDEFDDNRRGQTVITKHAVTRIYMMIITGESWLSPWGDSLVR